MTDENHIIDLLTAIVSTIETQDANTEASKNQVLKQLEIIASNTEKVSTNFPKLVEVLSSFDNKIASSFEDIEKITKQLNSVIQKVSLAETAIKSAQQQAQNLKLDATIRTLSDADQLAIKLNQHLNTASLKYQENMTAASTEALQQISSLKREVSQIADKFSEIIADNVSNKIINDVSTRLTQQFISKLKIDIETGAKEVSENLAKQAFQDLNKALRAAKNEVQEYNNEFNREVVQSYEHNLKRIKDITQEIEITSQKSNAIYLAREESYIEHVSKEKSATKRNWLLIGLGTWIGLSATFAGASYITTKSAESVVNTATGYVDMQRNMSRNGYRPISKEDCSAYLPRQQFMQNPQIDFCYISRKPYHQVDTGYGYLNIFTK